jgi:hypothetical protein
LRQKAVVWSILSAVGGAILLFVGQVAIEEYKSGQVAETKAAESQNERKQQRFERLDTMFDEYIALGPAVDRAGAYIDTGKGGSKDDVSLVVRHFRKLVSYGLAGRLELSGVLQLYGGRLIFWRDQLIRLGSGRSLASRDFTESELRTFLQVGESLRALSRPSSTVADRSPADVRQQEIGGGVVPSRERDRRPVERGAQLAESPMSEAEMEAYRQDLIAQARAQGMEIPESTLDQLIGGQMVAAASGGPDANIPPPGIKMSTEKAPTSALDAVVGRQSADNRSEASAKDPKPSASDDQ